MALTVRELVTSWGFDVDDKPLKLMDKTIKGMKTQLNFLKLAIGGTIATTLAMAKFTANAGDEAVKGAQKAGVTTVAFQEMAHAFGLAGIESGSMTNGLAILGTNARSAAQGGAEAKKAFRDIKVSATDAQGRLKPASQLLGEIADRFAGMSAAQRELAPALARGLFGRGGVEFLPLLYGGAAGLKSMAAEAHKLGKVISEPEAIAGERFNDNLTRMWTSIIGIRNVIGNALIPLLDPIVNGITGWVSSNRELIATAIVPWVQLLASGIKAVLSAGMLLADGLIQLTSALGGVADVLRVVLFLAAAFAIGKFLVAIPAVARSVWLMVGALKAMNLQLFLANALTGFVPLLLGLGALGVDWAIRGDKSIAGSLLGGGPVLPAAMGGNKTTNKNTTVLFQPTLITTVPAASNPQATGEAVGAAVVGKMEQFMRGASGDVKVIQEY